MPIIDLFSKRQRRLRGEMPDVYQYTNIPRELRAQIIHVFSDVFGDPRRYQSKTLEAYFQIHRTLCREYGRFALSDRPQHDSPMAEIFEFLMQAPTEEVLDFLEIALTVGRDCSQDWQFREYSHPQITVDQAIEELNSRFREHGVGFQISADHVLRVDSQLVHQETVRPALLLLAEKKFRTANDEFLSAHNHYREGRYKECLVDCLKALESVLKIICKDRNWKFPANATISKLLEVIFENELLPAALQSEFAALRSSLESGVPTLRNRLAGHGQGTEPVKVPEFIAAYLVHLTAASILLLVRAHER